MRITTTSCIRILPAALLVSLCLHETSLTAQEFALVTSQRAYVVNPEGKIEYSVPQHQLVEFDGDESDYLLIPHSGGNRIRKGHVRVLPELSTVNEGKPLRYNEQRVLRTAFRMLRDATKLSDEQKHDEAIKLALQANGQSDLIFLFNESPYRAYFLENLAYLEHLAGKQKLAQQHLEEADRYLKRISATDSLVASELHNVRGIIQLEEGEAEQAIESFRKAIEITKAKVGRYHLDYAVLNANLASAHSADGEADDAVRKQNESLSVLHNLLPKPAIEIPNGYTELGQYLLEDEKYHKAKLAFEIALLDHAVNHLQKHPADMASTRLGLADVYLAQEDYPLAKSTIEQGMKVELAKMKPLDEASYRKEYLYRLALVHYDQEQYEQAMPHVQEASKLHKQETEESVDGSIYTLIGHIHDLQGDSNRSKQAYQKARGIYTRVEGEKSESAGEVAQWIAELESRK